ncbi:alpha/beta fold hydrolase [Nocardioides euryhalodurans]|uniref:Alpha/beta hydrolase n=1 Tax=Nocardioides euryhalodurans TaxID=2518370 RepID=A0A4P7GK02_9ACTN|nr:alpha/beta hydrolase [Nocardioides euryhalodurans]QBR92094.1 alpha/beta hydrolase [Nocardioides euryhalodurans]
MPSLAFDRAGPTGSVPVLLVHAGVADRRMWESFWGELTARRDVLRVDLRGFGESTERPEGELAPHRDVLDVLAAEGIDAVHVVGASFGAGVAAEVAVTDPARVRSLLLAAPGGSLIPEMTDQLRAFATAENTALASGDLAAAVEANLATWVDGPGQRSDRVDPQARALVGEMQRRAFELTDGWDDVEEAELDPPLLERLGEIGVPTLVLSGGLDVDAIADAAARVLAGVPHSREVLWPEAAHLPSLERPEEFTRLLLDWLDEVG